VRHGLERYILVESGEATAAVGGEGEQVQIGYLAVPDDLRGVAMEDVAETEIIGPKLMVAGVNKHLQRLHHLGHQKLSVRMTGRIGPDPHQSMLCERAGRPP